MDYRDDFPDDWHWRASGQVKPPTDRLQHLVFVDGRLVDSWTDRVEGSAYETIARELDRERHPEPPPKPPWESELERLDPLVGGRAALLALGEEPLTERPVLPEECADVAAAIDRTELAGYDEELRIAVLNALRALHAAAAPMVRSEDPASLALVLAWLVGRDNRVVGPGTARTQKSLTRAFWLKGFPSGLASRVTGELRELRAGPVGYGYGYGGDRHRLGRADLLLAGTRSEIVRRRDRALDAAEQAKLDEQARARTWPAAVE